MATGERTLDRAATLLLGLGARLAALKRGRQGVVSCIAQSAVRGAAVPVRTLWGLGAGDAFGAALCHGLLSGWHLERTLCLANAAGAIVSSRLECADAMPTPAEVEALLAEGTAA